MRRGSRSVRSRLTLRYSVILFAGLCLFGAAIRMSLGYRLYADLDAALLQRTRGLERYIGIEAAENLSALPTEIDEFSRSLPGDYLLNVTDNAGRAISSVGPAAKPSGISYRSYAEVYRENGRTYRVSLSASTTSIDRTLHDLSILLLFAIPILVILSAGGGYWLSVNALAPVDHMTADARLIGFENLSMRLQVPQTDDELQRLAEIWNAMLARIEASAARMTRFTADASHELRTPLSLIRTTADVALRRSRTAESYRESLAQISLEAERMTRLLADLLFLARADAEEDRVPAAQTAADLCAELELAVTEVMPLALAKGVSVEIEHAPNRAPVYGNEEALRRMLFALLDNAVKYTPAGGFAKASIRLSAEKAIVSIRDSGTGISAQALPHIFERFFREDPSRQRNGSSYGLGLAIAQTIAQQHGTRIDVESEPHNTRFFVAFETVSS